MAPGDVYWVDFPGGAGRAQAGRRPAIIVQSEQATLQLPTVIVVPLSTQQDALRFPGTILIQPDDDNGLRQPSVGLAFQITVLDKRLLGSCLGKTSTTDLQALLAALDNVMDRHP